MRMCGEADAWAIERKNKQMQISIYIYEQAYIKSHLLMLLYETYRNKLIISCCWQNILRANARPWNMRECDQRH